MKIGGETYERERACLYGMACFVECKADKGKLADEQRRFLDRMRSLNARAGVARSVAEALDVCGLDIGETKQGKNYSRD